VAIDPVHCYCMFSKKKKKKKISYSVIMNQGRHNTTTHFKATKRILHYLNGTIDFGLLYPSSTEFKLVGYSDSDWGGDVDDRKSTVGFFFYLGSSAFT
jgi:hypothetical protein